MYYCRIHSAFYTCNIIKSMRQNIFCYIHVFVCHQCSSQDCKMKEKQNKKHYKHYSIKCSLFQHRLACFSDQMHFELYYCPGPRNQRITFGLNYKHESKTDSRRSVVSVRTQKQVLTVRVRNRSRVFAAFLGRRKVSLYPVSV